MLAITSFQRWIVFFKIKMRFVPKHCFYIARANCLYPLFHIVAKRRTVWAGSNKFLAIFANLRHIWVPRRKLGVGFTAKYTTHAPRIYINSKPFFFGKGYYVFHRLWIILQVFFGKCVQNIIKASLFNCLHIFANPFGISHSKISHACFHREQIRNKKNTPLRECFI